MSRLSARPAARKVKMPKETPLQRDLFTGELVDNRSRKEKRRDKKRTQPQQAELFSQREMAQFGVSAHPRIPLSPKTRLELSTEDPRSEEERTADERRDIEDKTYQLFPQVGADGEVK